MPGVGLMVSVVGLGSYDPARSNPAGLLNSYQVGLTLSVILPRLARCVPACWSTVGVAICPGLCPIAKESAEAAPTLCTEYGPH